MRTFYRHYGSVAELVEKATASRSFDAEDSWTDSWFLGREFLTWDDVVAAANGTWDEGVAEVERMLEEMASIELPQPKGRRRRPTWSADTGDDFDNDRFR